MIEALETLVKTCTVWNEQQKIQVLAWLECAKEFGENLDKCAEQLDEAKEIIRGLLSSCFGYNSKTVNYEVKAKAEDFLKECGE